MGSNKNQTIERLGRIAQTKFRAAGLPCTIDQSKRFCRIVLESIEQMLFESGTVSIQNFGTFALKTTPARIGTAPKTGERVEYPAHGVCRFYMGDRLRARARDVDPSKLGPVQDDEQGGK